MTSNCCYESQMLITKIIKCYRCIITYFQYVHYVLLATLLSSPLGIHKQNINIY